MEGAQKKSSARSYDAPAVVYEAALVAHAATTTLPEGGCAMSMGDLLDPTKGN